MKMNKKVPTLEQLPRREREVMNIVFEHGEITAAELQQRLPDQPSYAATRMLLQRLAKKDLLQHRRDGARYVYSATTPTRQAGQAAWRRLIGTFFGGSSVTAITSLLGNDELSEAELDELQRAIDDARRSRS